MRGAARTPTTLVWSSLSVEALSGGVRGLSRYRHPTSCVQCRSVVRWSHCCAPWASESFPCPHVVTVRYPRSLPAPKSQNKHAHVRMAGPPTCSLAETHTPSPQAPRPASTHIFSSWPHSIAMHPSLPCRDRCSHSEQPWAPRGGARTCSGALSPVVPGFGVLTSSENSTGVRRPGSKNT